MQKDTIKLSKFLSYVLRHKPESIKVKLDPNGWVSVDTLLYQANQHGYPIDHTTLESIVATNDKKRFSFSTDKSMIRAAQGHSSQQVSMELSEQFPPQYLYHGTAIHFLESINQQGLISKSRHHVHLSDNGLTAKLVGARHGQPVVLTIEARKMFESGYKFYLSDNQVWLTDKVPSQFILV